MKNWAILIGINHYDYLKSLKYAERDAELVEDFLKQEAQFDEVFRFSDHSPNIKRPNRQEIISKPTQNNLSRFIEQLTDRKKFMQAGDNFWFFFSGHGKRYNQRDYLMLSDSYPGNVGKTAIAVNDIVESLRNCGASNIVLILDACRDDSGDKAGEGIGDETQQGVITLYSCSPQQLSWEIEELKHSSFTYALLKGLKMKGEVNCATVKRLDDYLREQVPEINSKYNKPTQNPYTIAEPLRKSNLILLPQYISLTDSNTNTFKTDINVLKSEAYQASQIDENPELAYQLWHQVLAATCGQDAEAKKIIEKFSQSLYPKHHENKGNTSSKVTEDEPIISAKMLRDRLNNLSFKRRQVLLEILQGHSISEVARNLDITESAVQYNLRYIYKFFKIKNDSINEITGKKNTRKKPLLIALFKRYLPESINYQKDFVERFIVKSEAFPKLQPVNKPNLGTGSTSEPTNSVNQFSEKSTSESIPNLNNNEGYLIGSNIEPVKILILAANPKNTARLRLDKEVRDISEKLRASQEGIYFDIQDRSAVRFSDLRQELLEIEPHIVHFCGHGDTSGIVLEDDDGNADYVSVEALFGLFELFKNKIICVLFNACYSEPQAEAISKHISYVIGTSQAILDEAAISFSIGFYEALTNGGSIEFAYQIGRSSILAKVKHERSNKYKSSIPVLKRNNKQCKILKSQKLLSSDAPDKVTTRHSQENLSKILFSTANPRGTSPLRVSEEIRDIRNVIKKVRNCSLSIEITWATRVEDFRDAMLRLKPKIVHYSGHGAGQEGIIFENEQGEIHFIKPDALAKILKPFADQIECVIINASYSEVHALALARDIDYVIGMTKAIDDKASIAFSTGFYRALAHQYSIKEAFDFACSEIEVKLPETKEHLLPKIYGKKINTSI